MVAPAQPQPVDPPTLSNVNRRLTWVEGQLSHLASRSWVLGGVIVGMVISTGIALTIVQLVLK